ncbi:alkaline phosphatase family protein [Nocardioides alcanivorans]|uniref:alkaline phosphatase family protein n=1 Tax=Nocardioides alcanivorans TaxID=2897352 RepID=UPI001F2AA9AD|nr:alkaline phosphatase family protein [Nocardioides alcanivorans]
MRHGRLRRPGAGQARTTAPTEENAGVESPQVEHVVTISVDALAVKAIRKLGRKGTPTLHRMAREGAYTLNARTAREQNITLPNHASMVTGRRINKARGGHGVTWNVDRAHDTLQKASGDPDIESMFSIAHRADLRTAIFAGKSKFDLFTDSWPAAFDRQVIRNDHSVGSAKLVAKAVKHLVRRHPHLSFLHLPAPDAAGHAHGGMSKRYLKAVRAVDKSLAAVLAAIESDQVLRDSTLVVLTADHGVTSGHKNHTAHRRGNYTVPFIIWGTGVDHGDLYALNPHLANPRRTRPGYAGPQPVRNLQLAAVALEALGLPELDPRDIDGHELDW